MATSVETQAKVVAQPRRAIGRGVAGLILVAALVAFPFFVSLLTGQPVDVGTPKFWQGEFAQVFIWAVYALSYDLLFGYTGVLSFGHAMFFGTGAYVAGIFLKHAGWPFWAVVLAVIVVAILQGLLIGVLSLRVKGVYFAMVTLAFAQMFFILAEATDFAQWTGAEDGLHGIPLPDWLNATDNRLQVYYILLGFAILLYFIARRVVNSPVGKVMVAIRENENRAQMIGYNTFAYKLFAVTFAGLLAALGGLMQIVLNGSADAGLLSVNMTITVLLMVIIGGVGTLIGPMLGAAVYELLGYELRDLVKDSWLLVFGVVFILIVLFLPYGLVGTWTLKGGAWRKAWAERWRAVTQRDKPPEVQ